MATLKERPWDLGFGPVDLQPGEKKRINVQPKCHFRAEKILSHEGNNGIRLLAVYIGKDEVLNLNDGSIDLGRAKVDLKTGWSNPALPIEIDIVNSTKVAMTVDFNIYGQARL